MTRGGSGAEFDELLAGIPERMLGAGQTGGRMYRRHGLDTGLSAAEQILADFAGQVAPLLAETDLTNWRELDEEERHRQVLLHLLAAGVRWVASCDEATYERCSP